jgi:hypothetical protein
MIKTSTAPLENLEKALADVSNLAVKPEHPKSTDAIGNRLESSIDLIQNYVHEQLDELRTEIGHTEKLLQTDCDRARAVCQDMVRSAATIQTLKQSTSETLSALRSGRARLVPVRED